MRPKLMYVISEDWFFYSHFFERALAARGAGFRLLSVNFDRRSINPVKELMLLLRIYLAYRRERPDVVHHVAAKGVFYGSLAARLFSRRLAIVNAPVGMGYVFSSREE